MSALLTDNLPLLAGAPDGIKKLRELILELAVRGKLVPQEPSDEPASELLRRIAEEKMRLVAEGKIKKPKPLAEIGEEEKPFELPEGWGWQRFGEIFSLEYGDNLPADKRSNTGEYPVYGSNGVVGTHSVCFVESPCIVVGRKGSAGALNLCLSSGCCVTDVAYYCVPPSGCSLDYVFKLFHTLGLDSLGKGIKPGLNRNEAYELVVAIPPLAEQHRIVAKVEELMALCDRLETRQADAESAHVRLVQALLDSLTQANDAADFAASWQRLAEHFHSLFTSESSIDALKQTLLQLAVMGKLVPQDSNDEPATNLLQHYGIKSTPHFLDGWAEASLGSLGEILGGSTPSKANPEFWDGDIPWVSPKDMKRPVIHDAQDHISAKALAQTSLKAVPPQSLLMVVRGMILAHSFPVALTAREVTINQDMKALVPPEEISTYLLVYLQAAKDVMVGLVDRSSHGTCKLISEKLWSHTVCLPPLPEQHRIVAKLDQLMALCDQLKARLTTARQLHERLAGALVERAVA